VSRFTRHDIVVRFPDGSAYTRAWLAAHPTERDGLYARHLGGRPLCLCRPGGVELLVRARAGAVHLANLPGRGHHHAPSCPSYAPDPDFDPLRHYARGAVQRSVRGVFLSVSDEPTGPAPFQHVSPTALLEFLWDHAGLTYWSPRMSGRRTPQTARSALRSAADDVHVNDDRLRDTLLIPGPSAERHAAQPRYVLGAVRGFTRGAHNLGLHLAHDPSIYWIPPSSWSGRLADTFGPYSEPVLPPCDPAWILARVWYSRAGHAHLEGIGVMRVDDRWIPVFDADEAPLFAALAAAERRFVRVMPLDGTGLQAWPVATLRDTEVPTQLYNPRSRAFPAAYAADARAAGAVEPIC
jgi:hypothetical protein